MFLNVSIVYNQDWN